MTSPALFLRLLGPEAIVVAAALFILALDLTLMRDKAARLRANAAGLAACLGCAAAMLWLFFLPLPANGPSSMLALTPLTQFIKLILLALTIFTAVMSLPVPVYPARRRVFRAPPAGRRRGDALGQFRQPADDLSRAGIVQCPSLRDGRLRQVQPRFRRSGLEVFPVRRHVRRFHPLRHQLDLWNHGRNPARRHRGRPCKRSPPNQSFMPLWS